MNRSAREAEVFLISNYYWCQMSLAGDWPCFPLVGYLQWLGGPHHGVADAKRLMEMP